jgi:hypothetical protein
MAQIVYHLPSKLKALSSNPRIAKRNKTKQNKKTTRLGGALGSGV